MPRSAVAVPPALARRANKVLRPVDAAGAYANPRAELARLRRSGAVLRLATGYYALLPQERLGDQGWRPELEAAALGLAQSDYGVNDVALMGVSAARYHGAIPRALAVAIVAVPKQRPAVETEVGRITFVKRDVGRLDVERTETQLTSGWVTTVEQTLLDLADRPELGGLGRSDMDEAIRFLAGRADWTLVRQLASAQHKPAALRNATLIARPLTDEPLIAEPDNA
jgi:predicted transcriptional regulator of viral defense system